MCESPIYWGGTVCVQVDPTGPLANLKKLLFSTDNAVVQWLSVYWFIPAACVACLLTLVAVCLPHSQPSYIHRSPVAYSLQVHADFRFTILMLLGLYVVREGEYFGKSWGIELEVSEREKPTEALLTYLGLWSDLSKFTKRLDLYRLISVNCRAQSSKGAFTSLKSSHLMSCHVN